MLVYCLLLLTFSFAAQAQQAVGVRLVLGLTDKSETKWDGSVTAERARIASIEPWRFDEDDAILGNSSWRVSTHPIRLFGGGRNRPFVANGVLVWLNNAEDDARLNIKTAQGDFTVSLQDIPYGKTVHKLDGRVMADRIPPASRITTGPQEQDYPAAATGKNGNVWLAYIEFRHNKNHDRLRAPFLKPPSNFADLAAPTGADQVLLRKYSQGAWGSPIPITGRGADLYRVAITVDGSGRPWVFWSENRKANFDLWARVVDNGKPGTTVQLSNAEGSDIDPTAATDSQGRVWVAWQGWRNGKASIYAATQQRDRFSSPVTVSSSQGNEWNPAIAADPNGAVTVAWDSYRNGNYDIYARTARDISRWQPETPVATTARYEAYPSIAYDLEGRLWVAYEEGAERWGKDFGAYDTTGIALYQGRAVRLVGLERSGNRVAPKADLGALLPGVPEQRIDSANRQDDSSEWLTPDPQNARTRQPSRPATNIRAPKNSLPRLTVDRSGRLWLALRSAHPIWWSPLGTVWSEYLVSYDGTAWTGPVFLTHTGNLLDNRPSLISPRPGELMVIGSSDLRRQFHQIQSMRPTRQQKTVEVKPDPYNNDLFASVIFLSKAGGSLSVRAAGAGSPSALPASDKGEQASIAAMRSYRLKSQDGALRIIRGEFHRHSDVSMDGGNDGSLLDQWRYIIDAAAMDWVGCCDHDNGDGREYSWWITQKLTDVFYSPGEFSPMFSYERSVSYPEGHRNVVFVKRGIRPLPRLPQTTAESSGHAPDTLMLFKYLAQFDGVVASHTSGTNMGTDWRDNDPVREPVVEIYQGDRQNYEMPEAPRSNSEKDSIGGWRPKGFVNLALGMGYKLGFQASSDHISTHISYCNIYAASATREAVLDGLKKRHVYGSTDNIIADVRCGAHMMGDEFSISSPPELSVKLIGTAPFARVHVIKDDRYVYSAEPMSKQVNFTWRDNAPARGKTSYYYVRGEQEDGEIVWVSPMWITLSER